MKLFKLLQNMQAEGFYDELNNIRNRDDYINDLFMILTAIGFFGTLIKCILSVPTITILQALLLLISLFVFYKLEIHFIEIKSVLLSRKAHKIIKGSFILDDYYDMSDRDDIIRSEIARNQGWHYIETISYMQAKEDKKNKYKLDICKRETEIDELKLLLEKKITLKEFELGHAIRYPQETN